MIDSLLLVVTLIVVGACIWFLIDERHQGMRCSDPLGHRFVKNNKAMNKLRVCKACGLIQKSSGMFPELWKNQGYSEDKGLLIRCWRVEKEESEKRSRQWKIDHKNNIKKNVIQLDPDCEKYRKIATKEDGS